MKFTRYTVIGSLARIGASEPLQLTMAQAEARRHALEPQRDGSFVARQPLEFKSGEMIGLTTGPDELPRYLADILRPATKEEIAAADKADRAARAAAADAEKRGRARFDAEKVAAQEAAAAKKTKADTARQAREAKAKAEADAAAEEARRKAAADAGGN